MTARAAILEAARQAVTVDRAATHGAAEDSFARIAALWSARLGVPVTSAQVAIMMIDLKTVRAWGNPGHADNWVDIAGYAACGGELAPVIEAPADDPGWDTSLQARARLRRRPWQDDLDTEGGA